MTYRERIRSQTGNTPNRAAFVQVISDLEQPLLRTAIRLCRGNDDAAQDLVQDTLIRGYEAYMRGQFGNSGFAWRAWLTRIMMNLYINDYRRKMKWDAGIDLETLTSNGEIGPSATHVPPSDIPGVSLMDDILDEEIEAALNSLSDALRFCVLLVDIEGMDYSEAARALNIPIGTVRSRLSRARMSLHNMLADYAKNRRKL